jgi:hypothetical protein
MITKYEISVKVHLPNVWEIDASLNILLKINIKKLLGSIRLNIDLLY